MSRCCVAVRLANSWVIPGKTKGPHGGGPFYPLGLFGCGAGNVPTATSTGSIPQRDLVVRLVSSRSPSRALPNAPIDNPLDEERWEASGKGKLSRRDFQRRLPSACSSQNRMSIFRYIVAAVARGSRDS